SPTTARAMPTRCCSPAESWVGSACSRSSRPRRPSTPRTRLPISPRRRPRRISGRATLSNTLRSVSRRWSWNTTPTSRRCSATRRPRTLSRLRSLNTTAPRLGRSARWISLSRVLLPAPEWPVRNSISPAATSKLTSASATRTPEYCLLTLSKRRTAMARSIAELALAAPGRRARFPRLAAVRATARTDRANAAGANRRRAAWSGLSLRRARHRLAQARADARHQRRRLRRRRFGRARRGLLARGARLARRGLASLRLAAVGVGRRLGAVHALAATAATALARRPGFIRHRGRDRGGRVDHRRGRGRGRRFRRRGLRGFAAGRGLPGPGPRLAPGPRPLAVAAARAWPAAAGASAGT